MYTCAELVPKCKQREKREDCCILNGGAISNFRRFIFPTILSVVNMKPIVSCFRHFKPTFYIFDNFWKFSEFKFSLLYKKTIIKFTWFILHIKIRGLNEIFSYKTDFTANLHFSRRFFWGIKHKNLFFFRFFSPKGPPVGFWKLWSKMRNYTKVSGKKQKQIWNQWAKLFHLPPVNVF